MLKDSTHFKSVEMPRHMGFGLINRQILIVEDDVAYRHFWRSIITKNKPQAAISWASSEKVAAELLMEKEGGAHPYDLVILDIFLSGEKTGLDLWAKARKSAKEFLFVSSLPKSRYESLVKSGDNDPICLEKPLVGDECAAVIRSLL